jgi:hypothetical protein
MYIAIAKETFNGFCIDIYLSVHENKLLSMGKNILYKNGFFFSYKEFGDKSKLRV